MPCYDPRVTEDPITGELILDGNVHQKYQQLVRMLCEACKYLPHTANGTELAGDRFSKELKDWYREHDKMDRIRLTKERQNGNK